MTRNDQNAIKTNFNLESTNLSNRIRM